MRGASPSKQIIEENYDFITTLINSTCVNFIHTNENYINTYINAYLTAIYKIGNLIQNTNINYKLLHTVNKTEFIEYFSQSQFHDINKKFQTFMNWFNVNCTDEQMKKAPITPDTLLLTDAQKEIQNAINLLKQYNTYIYTNENELNLPSIQNLPSPQILSLQNTCLKDIPNDILQVKKWIGTQKKEKQDFQKKSVESQKNVLQNTLYIKQKEMENKKICEEYNILINNEIRKGNIASYLPNVPTTPPVAAK